MDDRLQTDPTLFEEVLATTRCLVEAEATRLWADVPPDDRTFVVCMLVLARASGAALGSAMEATVATATGVDGLAGVAVGMAMTLDLLRAVQDGLEDGMQRCAETEGYEDEDGEG